MSELGMSGVSRRRFMMTAAALAGSAAVLPAFGQPAMKEATKKSEAQSSETWYRWVEVRPGFHVAIGRTGDDMMLVGGNSTLVARRDVGVMIDTKQFVLGPSLAREAKLNTDAVVQVINTHHHADHVGGNAAFAKGAAIVAHAKCRERVMASVGTYTAQLSQKIDALEKVGLPGAREAAADARKFAENLADVKPEAFVPAVIEMDKVKDLAGHKVEVHHVGAGHTDNDLFMFFPDDNVLVAGDLVFNGLHPYFDKAGGADSRGWVKSLARIVTLCDAKTVVVSGHGDVGDLETVKKQIKYFEDVQAAVAKAIKEGKAREDVEKMRLPQYAAYKLEIAQPLVMGGVFDELSKK